MHLRLSIEKKYIKRALVLPLLITLSLIPAIIDIAYPDEPCYTDVGVPCFDDIAGPIISFFLILLVLVFWHFFMITRVIQSKKNNESRTKNAIVLLYPILIFLTWLSVEVVITFIYHQKITKNTFRVDTHVKEITQKPFEVITAYKYEGKNYVVTGIKAESVNKRIPDSGVVMLRHNTRVRYTVMDESLKWYRVRPGSVQPISMVTTTGINIGTEYQSYERKVRPGVLEKVRYPHKTYHLPSSPSSALAFQSEGRYLTLNESKSNVEMDIKPLYGYRYSWISLPPQELDGKIYHFVTPKRRARKIMPLLSESVIRTCYDCIFLAELGGARNRVFHIDLQNRYMVMPYNDSHSIIALFKEENQLIIVGRQNMLYFAMPY